MKNTLVDVNWLSQNIHRSDIVILDATQASKKADLPEGITDQQIPGALPFDIKNNFSDPNSSLPNTMPSPSHFEKESCKLGINDTTTIVVYDDYGIYFSPRVWWMYKVMGHNKVVVLNGGFTAWIEANQPTENKTKHQSLPGNFTANFNSHLIKTYDDIIANISSNESLLIDARSSGRFQGIVPEPRAGMLSGHIPNSENLPYTTVLENGKYKSKQAIQLLFDELPINDKPLIFSCGSGITACIILLAHELIGGGDKMLYDGSWTEWVER